MAVAWQRDTRQGAERASSLCPFTKDGRVPNMLERNINTSHLLPNEVSSDQRRRTQTLTAGVTNISDHISKVWVIYGEEILKQTGKRSLLSTAFGYFCYVSQQTDNESLSY